MSCLVGSRAPYSSYVTGTLIGGGGGPTHGRTVAGGCAWAVVRARAAERFATTWRSTGATASTLTFVVAAAIWGPAVAPPIAVATVATPATAASESADAPAGPT